MIARGKVAFLFPAFSMRYRDFSRKPVAGYPDEVARFLSLAAKVVKIDERKFERPSEFMMDDDLQDDLQNHYVSYVDSCALAALLEKRGVRCDYIASYSMGLFAALCHSGAISFEDGLTLLHNVCTSAHGAVKGSGHGMGVVVGLTDDEITALIREHCPELEVADVCAPRVVIASGRRTDIETLFEVARAAGSLHSRFLPVTLPFHSSLIRQTESRIREVLERIVIRPPTRRLVSAVNQELLESPDDVRAEAAGNLWHPLRWHQTVRRLLDLGVDVFVECGLSDSLCNLARNVEGDFRAYHPRKFDQLGGWLTGNAAWPGTNATENVPTGRATRQ